MKEERQQATHTLYEAEKSRHDVARPLHLLASQGDFFFAAGVDINYHR